MSINDYTTISKNYASLDNSGTALLAFKTIPSIIKKYAKGNKTLDYGCGSGSSTIFLDEIGLNVEGVDISQEMLFEAIQENNKITYTEIKSAELPFQNDFFDIVFSSFVLFEIPNKNELKKIMSEIFRVLKKGGIFIGVTGSMQLYDHQWLSLDVNFEQNKNLKSGDIAKVLLKDADLIVYDYYWTDNDYNEVFNESNLRMLEKTFPLGESSDGYEWADEKNYPPYVVYVLIKD